jgi:Mn2+/Fe2+ NRAMP family transporter
VLLLAVLLAVHGSCGFFLLILAMSLSTAATTSGVGCSLPEVACSSGAADSKQPQKSSIAAKATTSQHVCCQINNASQRWPISLLLAVLLAVHFLLTFAMQGLQQQTSHNMLAGKHGRGLLPQRAVNVGECGQHVLPVLLHHQT